MNKILWEHTNERLETRAEANSKLIHTFSHVMYPGLYVSNGDLETMSRVDINNMTIGEIGRSFDDLKTKYNYVFLITGN